MSNTSTCCFFGHRKIGETEELKQNLDKIIEWLIVAKKVDTFLFGSKSQFDFLCLKRVTRLKEKYPHIKRVYVRAEFPIIDERYREYLMGFYDETYFPDKLTNAGKAIYVERNYEMINNSYFCVVYYDSLHAFNVAKSGTKIAFDYAKKTKKQIYNVAKNK